MVKQGERERWKWRLGCIIKRCVWTRERSTNGANVRNGYLLSEKLRDEEELLIEAHTHTTFNITFPLRNIKHNEGHSHRRHLLVFAVVAGGPAKVFG